MEDETRARKKIPVTCRHWLSGRCNVIQCRFLHETPAPASAHEVTSDRNSGRYSQHGAPSTQTPSIAVGGQSSASDYTNYNPAPGVGQAASALPPATYAGATLNNPINIAAMGPPGSFGMGSSGDTRASHGMGSHHREARDSRGWNNGGAAGAGGHGGMATHGTHGMGGNNTVNTTHGNSVKGTPNAGPVCPPATTAGATDSYDNNGGGNGGNGGKNRKGNKDSQIVCRHWMLNRCNVPTCRFKHSLETEWDTKQEDSYDIYYFACRAC